jgi:hypothetical protein
VLLLWVGAIRMLCREGEEARVVVNLALLVVLLDLLRRLLVPALALLGVVRWLLPLWSTLWLLPLRLARLVIHVVGRLARLIEARGPASWEALLLLGDERSRALNTINLRPQRRR